MAYPPPPGLASNKASLPARPPAGQSLGNAFAAFKPRQVGGVPGGGAGPAAPPSWQQPAAAAPDYAYSNYPPATQSYEQSTQAPAQIRNPFPAPGEPGSGGGEQPYDPELEANIAQWQSAYAIRDSNARTPYRFGEGTTSTVNTTTTEETSQPSRHEPASKKQKTVVRSGGGKTWQDGTLLEWDPAHFRLFVGNLAGEVTDDSLLKAFARYPSVQKARVIRDKRTTKSKGYGFISFSDGEEYFQAAKEMQGKYIGSHPVLLRRSDTEIKAVAPSQGGRGKGGRGGGSGGRGGHAGDRGGVSKKQAKTKNGLRILG